MEETFSNAYWCMLFSLCVCVCVCVRMRACVREMNTWFLPI